MPPPEQYIAPHRGFQIKSPLWQLTLPSWDDLPHFIVSLQHSALPSLLQNSRSHIHTPALWHVLCFLFLPQDNTNSKYLLCPGHGPCHGPCLGPGRLLVQLLPHSSHWRSHHGPARGAHACCLGASLQQREAEGALEDAGTSPEQAHYP